MTMVYMMSVHYSAEDYFDDQILLETKPVTYQKISVNRRQIPSLQDLLLNTISAVDNNGSISLFRKGIGEPFVVEL